VSGQHSSHVQVFDDDPVVSLGQLAGNLVQEMPPNIGDVMVMPPEPGGGVFAVL
jgi:hypothetical protein